MDNYIAQALQVYGLAIVISMLAAVVIRVIVLVLGFSERKAATPAAVPAAAAKPVDIAEHDIAAITAAIYAVVGAHRIVRIDDARGSQGWVFEGRWMHQTSHSRHGR